MRRLIAGFEGNKEKGVKSEEKNTDVGKLLQFIQKAGVLQRGQSDKDKVNQSESVTTNFLQTIRIIRTGRPLKR